MKRLSRWLSVLVLGCPLVFAFPAAGASNTPPGALDASFGASSPGISSIAPACLNHHQFDPVAGALQRDGKIVLVGACGDSNNFQELLVVRLTGHGHLDPSFNAGGFVIAQLGNPQSVSDSVVLQPDGKIVVGGSTTSSLRPLGPPVFTVWRLNPDGSFDPTFGTAGTVTESSVPEVSALALQPDGKIIAGGDGKITATDVGGDGFVARLNPDGSFDTSFASGGVRQLAPGEAVAALALRADGKIIAAGNERDQITQGNALLVARLNSRGNLDPTFGNNGNGIFLDQLGTGQTPHSWATAVVVQPDGKVVVGGTWTRPGQNQLVVARLVSNGQLDSSFGSSGIVTEELAGAVSSQSSVQALALQPNGKILAAGGPPYAGDTNGAIVMRLRANGRPDIAFGGQGVVELPLPDSQYTTIALQPNGKLVAAGTARLNGVAQLLAARLIVDLPPAAAFKAPHSPTTAGQQVTFDGGGSSDSDGSITGYAWRFGDGRTATGSKPTHTYARRGRYVVTLSVTDDYGLTNGASHTIRVSRPLAPALSLLRLQPGSFRAAAHGDSIGGTTVSYRKSLAGSTRFTIVRVLHGRVSHQVRIPGSFNHQDRKGANRFHFTGRLRSHSLKPGSYRLNATPIARGRTGTTIHIRFRIVP